MKRFMVAFALLLPAVASAGTYEAPLDVRAGQGEAKLVSPPAVSRDGDKVTIAFEASAATDVEVAVLGADGKIVRHLAAGLLGRNAPAPLKADSLKQTLTWDGKDDAGKPVAGEATVRVRLGVRPQLEKHLGFDGQSMDPIQGLAVGEGGELYVMMRSWVSRGRRELRVYDRDGKYRRTIMPYSAKTPAERTGSVGQLEIEGERIPIVFNGHGHSLYPLSVGLPKQNMAWNPKGHLVVVSTLATAFEHGLPRHLLAFDPNGGAPKDVKFIGPQLRPPTGITWGHGEGDDPCFDHVACSPDGKWTYYTHSTYDNRHAIFRLQWGEDEGSGMEAAFIGEDYHPGADDRHLNDPQGLAVDAAGRIYVCDRGNDRVMIYSPAGKLVGKFAVANPEQIAVHPKTGEIYIASRQARWGGPPKDIGPMAMDAYRRWKEREAERKENLPKAEPPAMLKFTAFTEQAAPKQAARLDQGVDLFALDASGERPRLWASIKNRLHAIDDAGEKLELGEPAPAGDGLVYPGYIQADPDRNRVLLYALSSKYLVRSVDLATGEKTSFIRGVSDIAMAPDGSFFVGTGTYGSDKLLRFGPDGKPQNWPGSDSNAATIGDYRNAGVGLGLRGLVVAPSGDIYIVRNGQEKGVATQVDVVGPDGKVKKRALVDGMGTGDCGIGVDPAGNVYVGANVKPADARYPKEFMGKIPDAPWLVWAKGRMPYRSHPWEWSMRNEYLYHWGAVLKFPADGGAFYGRGSFTDETVGKRNPVVHVDSAPTDAASYYSGYMMKPVKVAGAEWRYPGMGPLPASERQWGDPSCVCITSRLAVDGFGRVFVPNVFRFCVEMTDTAGNRIERVGKYGNSDDEGLQFAWPAFVDVKGDRLYVSDSVNRRVTVVRLAATDEATTKVK